MDEKPKLNTDSNIDDRLEKIKREREAREKALQADLSDVATSKINDSEISKLVSNKIEAMEKFNLRPVTKSGKYDLEKELYDAFSYLASKLNKDIQEMASEYVLEGLKKDLKKQSHLFHLPQIK